MLRSLLFTLVMLLGLHVFSQTRRTKINYAKEGYVKAKVIKYEVENCGFLLELADKEKTKIAPNKLDDSFKKKGLKVWVKYSLVKQQVIGTCMAGKQAEIVDIKKRR